MSIARITTVKMDSKEAADDQTQGYVQNAPSEFPQASQLIGIWIDDVTLMAVTIYPDAETMKAADVAREKRLNTNLDNRVSVETLVGDVTSTPTRVPPFFTPSHLLGLPPLSLFGVTSFMDGP